MHVRRYAAIAALVLVFARGAFAEETNPREDVMTVATEMIRLLEAKEYKTFIQNFMPPTKLKDATQGNPAILDEMVKSLDAEKIAPMLKALKQIKDTKPTIDADGKKAKFALKEKIDEHESMTFVKVDKYWYLDD